MSITGGATTPTTATGNQGLVPLDIAKKFRSCRIGELVVTPKNAIALGRLSIYNKDGGIAGSPSNAAETPLRDIVMDLANDSAVAQLRLGDNRDCHGEALNTAAKHTLTLILEHLARHGKIGAIQVQALSSSLQDLGVNDLPEEAELICYFKRGQHPSLTSPAEAESGYAVIATPRGKVVAKGWVTLVVQLANTNKRTRIPSLELAAAAG